MAHYRRFKAIARQIEELADEALQLNEGVEPTQSSLLNIKGDISAWRDAIEHAKGQDR